MFAYKISDYDGGPFYYRERDDSVMRLVYNFLEMQETGNTIFIEVVEISRKEYDDHARADRLY